MSAIRTTSMITVAVTGVGAIIGQGIVRSLRRMRPAVRVVGIDRSDRSVGPSMCDTFVCKPAVAENSPAYRAFWTRLVARERIDLVLPGLDADVAFFDRERTHCARIGLHVALNTPLAIALGSDKAELAAWLQRHGLPAIPSVQGGTWLHALAKLGPPPLLLKPRHGSGGRGIVRLHDDADFRYWTTRTDHWLLQPVVGTDDMEYTVGVFGFGDGTALAPIVLRRRLSAEGNTREAEVVDDAVVAAASSRLTAALAPLGPTNYQFRKQDGQAWLLEVNPRFSSSNSLRTRFGFNEARMCLDWYLHSRQPAQPRLRHGIGWRYFEDYVVHARRPV